ncbi:SufD family Fe-S cluster assembly protein [candidate division WOR-3 bacterium]|nr:SufD family Fe-S cluster assembly protein [candidate division WOR-3 bacterium]
MEDRAIQLFSETGQDIEDLTNPNVAHLIINNDKVVSKNDVEGLSVKTYGIENGVHIVLNLYPGIIIERPVHLCFGMLLENGIQNIQMETVIGEGSSINVLSHCVFPNAVDIQHIMNNRIKLEKKAVFRYYERHVHSENSGMRIVPKSYIDLAEGARFASEFVLLKGRAGTVDVEYEAKCGANSVVEMLTRISGRGDDKISIKETGLLEGQNSRGVLKTKIALRDNSRADVFNKLIAQAAMARGHVDCKEIVMDQAIANAVPIVEVRHPKAHVTHEASIGSVDNKQLETLMSRGMTEESAEELIIGGLLSG